MNFSGANDQQSIKGGAFKPKVSLQLGESPLRSREVYYTSG